MPLSPGQLLLDRYRIDALIAQGGMGAVYDAFDTRLNIRCAIKENQLGTESALRQFEREAQLLAKLRHPNLPRVTDHFLIPGQGQYLVMDFVEGEDLGRRLKRLGPLPEADARRWAEVVLSALAYLHARGVIHRDIKPGNIKFTPEGETVLVDFGIAKEMSGEGGPTTTGARGLTPGFAPPEQYGGTGRTDARSNLYAFGATLYALLTGAPPADAFMRLTDPHTFAP
jgi:serine/threonine protein kinase